MGPDRQDASPSLSIIIVEQSFPVNGALQFLAFAIGAGHAELRKQYNCRRRGRPNTLLPENMEDIADMNLGPQLGVLPGKETQGTPL